MTNEQYIAVNREKDTRMLSLQSLPEGVDRIFCMTQIESWQAAREKLPEWSEYPNLIFPPRLSMEQCSSQQTAYYKRQVIQRLIPDAQEGRFVDLTGGFGVDFCHIASLFGSATYIERQPHLCDILRHNSQVLGIARVAIVCSDAEEALFDLPHQQLIFLDPARRDDAGRKVVALADCMPDVTRMYDLLLKKADVVMLKLSPMLDITQTLRQLPDVREVHVVSVDGECKELLLVLSRKESALTYYCADLGKSPVTYLFSAKEEGWLTLASAPQTYLYEPFSCLLKAGVQDVLCSRFGVAKLHPFSNLFTCEKRVEDFPGRAFCVEGWCGYGKKEVKQLLGDVQQANITVRNFPATVHEIRKRLRLKEGGGVYLFATTLSDGSHALIRCRK